MPNIDSDIRNLIETGLREYLPASRPGVSQPLNQAIRSAVFPGGRRLRPVLTILAARLVGGTSVRALSAACAIEFLHTSSLIFDDLPAMDNADTRRGSAALHRVCGEDLAMLAALALLNRAYALFGRTPALLAEAVECIGMDGMIGGQALDLAGSEQGRGAAQFAERNRKTSALMRLTLTAGALACGASQDDLGALARAGEYLGQAYQVWDDLVDCFLPEGTGKPSGQDARHGRPNHVAEFGSDACSAQVLGLVQEAKFTLRSRFGSAEATERLLTHVDGMIGEVKVADLVTA